MSVINLSGFELSKKITIFLWLTEGAASQCTVMYKLTVCSLQKKKTNKFLINGVCLHHMHKPYGLLIKIFFTSRNGFISSGPIQSAQCLNIPAYLVKCEPAFLIQGDERKTDTDSGKLRQKKCNFRRLCKLNDQNFIPRGWYKPTMKSPTKKETQWIIEAANQPVVHQKSHNLLKRQSNGKLVQHEQNGRETTTLNGSRIDRDNRIQIQVGRIRMRASCR